MSFCFISFAANTLRWISGKKTWMRWGNLKSTFFPFFLPGFSFTYIDELQDCRGRQGIIFIHFSLPSTRKSSDIYLQLYMWDDLLLFLIASHVITKLLLDGICLPCSSPICNTYPELKSVPRFVISFTSICNVYPNLKSLCSDLKSLPWFVIFLSQFEIP